MPTMELDKVLAASITAAKSKEHFFAIVAKGPAAVHLFISKTPIKDADVQKAKKEFGGNGILRGKCQGEGGPNLVFRVAVKPTVDPKKLKEFIFDATKLTVAPRFEITKVAEVEAVEGQIEENKPEEGLGGERSEPSVQEDASAVSGADVMKRFNSMAGGIKAHLTGPDGPEVQKLFVAAGKLLKTQEFAKANKVLDDLEPLIKKEPTTGAASQGQSSQGKSSQKPADDFPKRWATVSQVWLAAIESVDQQIAALQAVLSKEDDGELQEIAEFGLNGVTGNFKTPFMTAMREVDGSDVEGRPKAARKVAEIANAFMKHLESDERVMAVDENPFNVKLTVRKTLGDALAAIGKILQTSN